ncbi:MAG: glycosyltransferase family 9 protein [Planctomycetes bacterium]|nr:glycosyltransferase family 9 protein [Planctomycetota bacterium]
MTDPNENIDVAQARANLADAMTLLCRGSVPAAMSAIAKMLAPRLRSKQPPDPVEWAYFILAALCRGSVANAARYAAQFPKLEHSELRRVRGLVQAIQTGKPPQEISSPDKEQTASIHEPPARTFDQWLDHVSGLLRINGQIGMSRIAAGGRKETPAKPQPVQPANAGPRKVLYAIGTAHLKDVLENYSGPRFREYAKHHGFEYRQITEYEKLNRPQPTWIKTHYVLRLLDELADGDLIAYLDADIAIVRGDVELTTLKSVAFARDSAGMINYGVFAARVCPFTREFFKKVHERTDCDAHPFLDNQALINTLDELPKDEFDRHVEFLPNCLNVTIIAGEVPTHEQYLKNPCDEPVRFRHFAGGQPFLRQYFEKPVEFAPPGGPAADQTEQADLPIHFFTIVLNGMPFTRWHIEALRDLPFNWHWHVMEGVADLKHDTAWSVRLGGKVPDGLHRDGLSIDGTTEYLDGLAKLHPDKITIYRPPPGKFWDGKRQMVNAPLANIAAGCLLWEIDADELWTAPQIVRARQMFIDQPDKTSALYWCWFFVGPDRLVSTRGCYGNHGGGEWLRTWRYRPGDTWAAHEPPFLARQMPDGNWQNVAAINPIQHDQTERAGLIFQHYAYALEEQLQFKESYYGYKDAVAHWRRLQDNKTFPARLSEFFPWVTDAAMVDRAESLKVEPMLTAERAGGWSFRVPQNQGDFAAVKPAGENAPAPADVQIVNPLKLDLPDAKHVLWVRTDAIGDNILASSMLPYVRKRFPNARITVLCQERVGELYEACPFVDDLFFVDRKKSLMDMQYVNDIALKLRELKADVALNSICSREPYADALALASDAAVTIALEGDTDQMTADLREKTNKQYKYIIPSPEKWKPELERHRDFVRGLGFEAPELQPVMWLTPQDHEWAANFLKINALDPKRCFAFFAAAGHFQKVYLRFGEAIDHTILAKDSFMICLGTDEDRHVNIANLTTANYIGMDRKVVDMTGQTTVRQSAALVQLCRMAIGVDTSLAHIACAMGTPNVVIMYGGRFGRFHPYSPLTSVVCLPLNCYHCEGRCTHARAYCVRDIAPEVVAKAISRTLGSKSDLPRVFVQGKSFWKPPAGSVEWDNVEKYLLGIKCKVIVVDQDNLINA